MNSEIKSLTGVRGVAALYVIVYHWYQVLILPKNLKFSDVRFFDELIKTFLGHGYLSVDLFFVLSGFVLGLSAFRVFHAGVPLKDYKRFMYKRFIRIFPLYICITSLFFVLFHRWHFSSLIVNFTLFQGLSHRFNDSFIPPGWSLTNEWIMYFLFPFLFTYAFKTQKIKWILVFFSLMFLILISYVRSPGINWANYKSIEAVTGINPIISFTRGPASLLRTFAAYLLGTFAFLMFKNGNRIPFLKYLIIPIPIMLFFKYLDILIILSVPFLVLYLVQKNYLNKVLSTKPIHFLGLISYSLYVNHFLFILSYTKLSKYSGYDNNTLSLCFILAGSIVFSCLTYYLIEKPATRFFNRKQTKAYEKAVVEG